MRLLATCRLQARALPALGLALQRCRHESMHLQRISLLRRRMLV